MNAGYSLPQKQYFSKFRLLGLFVNACINSSRRKYNLLIEIFHFLKLVIQNHEFTKMDTHNIATIFSPLLLPSICGTLSDVTQIIAESNAQIQVMKFILDVILNNDDIFQLKSKINSKITTQSGKLNDDIVIRGDFIVEFYSKDHVVCILFNEMFYVIGFNQYCDLFSSVKDSGTSSSPTVQLRIATPNALKKHVKRRLSARSARYVKST